MPIVCESYDTGSQSNTINYTISLDSFYVSFTAERIDVYLAPTKTCLSAVSYVN